jgi:2-keto-4-pentenoate hydratase/2-oxohepta-3-ene-1,7-dioic acid hydratase in catechol pathway
MTFRLLTYVGRAGTPRAGLLVDDKVIDVATASAALGTGFDATTVLGLLQRWDEAVPLLERIAGGTTGLVAPLPEVTLKAPILYPGQIYCAVSNYSLHLREMKADRKIPNKLTDKPYFFAKVARQAVIGPGETVRLPVPDQKVDWEAEIAVVIGRPARRVRVEDAMACIAGYTIMCDLSARAWLFRNDWDFKVDWFGGKSFDTSAPMGPWITPAAAVENPHRLHIRLTVNGEVRQDGSSEDMIFTIPEQIAYLSEHLTLLPGDVIATGTCAGVGHPTGNHLVPGDRIEIEIEKLGRLSNPVIADA